MQPTFSHQLEWKRAETDQNTEYSSDLLGRTYTLSCELLPPTLFLGPDPITRLLQSHGECLYFGGAAEGP